MLLVQARIGHLTTICEICRLDSARQPPLSLRQVFDAD